MQMTAGTNLVVSVGFCVFYSFFFPMESLDGEQSDRKCRINFNPMKLEVLVEEVNDIF